MFEKEMFAIKCSDCGKTEMVHFQPTVGKPVYCRICFAKYMSRGTEIVGRDSRFGPRQAWTRRRDGEERKKGYASVFQQH
jgi:CxxC-x17-CxxC domain-containing protein